MGWIIGGGATLLVLILAAVLIIPAVATDEREEAIRDLFTALAESDAKTAQGLSAEQTYNVTDEMLRRSNEIAPLQLQSVDGAGDDRYTVVFTLGPDEYRATVRATEQYGTVKIDDVTTRVKMDMGDTYLNPTLNGESAYGDMHLYPGVYEIEVDDNDYVDFNPSQIVVDLSQPTNDAAPEILASDSGKQAAEEAMWAHIEECAEYASADSTGCPMKLEERGGSTISGVDWELEGTSLEQFEETDGSGAHYGGKVTFTATATYTEYASDYSSSEDKTTRETFTSEMFVDLTTGSEPRVDY